MKISRELSGYMEDLQKMVAEEYTITLGKKSPRSVIHSYTNAWLIPYNTRSTHILWRKLIHAIHIENAVSISLPSHLSKALYRLSTLWQMYVMDCVANLHFYTVAEKA